MRWDEMRRVIMRQGEVRCGEVKSAGRREVIVNGKDWEQQRHESKLQGASHVQEAPDRFWRISLPSLATMEDAAGGRRKCAPPL